jgi:hypothetical protein
MLIVAPRKASAERFKLEPAKGWNRLVLRISPGERDSFVVSVLHAWAGAENGYNDTGHMIGPTADGRLPGVRVVFFPELGRRKGDELRGPIIRAQEAS